MRKIIVYGSTTVRAFDKLQSLLDNMRYGDVKKVNKSIDRFEVKLTNGDIYVALRVSDNARGHRWNSAYIDLLIPQETIDTLILPNYIKNETDARNFDRELDYGYYD